MLPKVSPTKTVEDGPRQAQDRPQDGPKRDPDMPKKAPDRPRGSQDGPKTAQNEPKMAPRWPQEGFKRAPKRLEQSHQSDHEFVVAQRSGHKD